MRFRRNKTSIAWSVRFCVPHDRTPQSFFASFLGPAGLFVCLVTIGLLIATCTGLKLNLIRSKPAIEQVPRGEAHHIYRVCCWAHLCKSVNRNEALSHTRDYYWAFTQISHRPHRMSA